MAKRRSGSIAVPFLITIFVGLLIVGGAAFGIYKYFGFNKEEPLTEPEPRAVNIVTAEDDHTILFILDEPEKKCSSTFMLMRSKPKEKHLTLIGIPTNTIAIVDGSQQKLQDSYERGGAPAAVNFTEQTFGIKVDRYMKFDSESLIKLCDIIGGVTYNLDADIAGFQKDGGEQFLNGKQVETLVTYSMFEGREVRRAYVASSIFAAMLNQNDGKRISDNFKNSFDIIINMISTDVTSVDFRNRQYAIRSMLENGNTIASSLILDGEVSNNDFIPSAVFLNDLREQYFQE